MEKHEKSVIFQWLCIPFAWMNDNVMPLASQDIDWIGYVPPAKYGHYLDYGLLLILGGIPWQVYFQRVLSSKTAGRAQTLSYVAAAGCILMAIPPVLIGAIAKSTSKFFFSTPFLPKKVSNWFIFFLDWTNTDYTGPFPLTIDETAMILPMVLQYLTPDFVSFFGLGAVSAAVMSSADSSILSASSMFARNVYKLIFRQNVGFCVSFLGRKYVQILFVFQASEIEIIRVMQVATAIVGVLATIMALTVPSIYGLW